MTLALIFVACALPVHAGSWSGPVYTGTVTVNGGTPTPLTPMSPGLNYYHLFHANATVSGTFTVTFTWVHADPNNPGADPPPTQLTLLATGTASWTSVAPVTDPVPTGACSDGLGDTETDTSTTIPANGNEPAYLEPSGNESGTWAKTVSSSSGTATLTISPSGMAQRQQAPYGDPISFTLAVTTAPHAIPVNFRVTGHNANNATGVLTVNFAWDSSDGTLADLSNCTVYELVDFNGNQQGSYGNAIDGTPVYFLPSPPCSKNYNYANPTKTSKPATDGMTPDTYSPPSWLKPYSAASWSGNQMFYFDDPADGLTKISLFNAGSIDRNVTLIAGPSRYKYVVTHLNYSATLPSLP